MGQDRINGIRKFDWKKQLKFCSLQAKKEWKKHLIKYKIK